MSTVPPCWCEVDMRKGTEVVKVHVELTNDRCCWSRHFAWSTWLSQLIKLHPHNNSWFQVTAAFIKSLRGCPFVFCCESIIKLPLIRSWRGWAGHQSIPTRTTVAHIQGQFRVNMHVVGQWKGGEEETRLLHCPSPVSLWKNSQLFLKKRQLFFLFSWRVLARMTMLVRSACTMNSRWLFIGVNAECLKQQPHARHKAE